MILPESCYMVTRRTSQRLFMLRPRTEVKRAFRYCLGLACNKSGVVVHAYVVMSNHYHIVCSDPEGMLPVFIETLNKLVARCLNVVYERSENFWAGGVQTNCVRLEDAESVLKMVVYVLANPVDAGLVAYGNEWPGLREWHSGRNVAKRPKFYFAENGRCSKEVEFELTPAPIGVAESQVFNTIKSAVGVREKEIRATFGREGRSFMGRTKVLAQSWKAAPSKKAMRRGLSPRLAAFDRLARTEAIARLKAFHEAYQEALRHWREGERDVVFPLGTYKMRTLHAACCET